LSVGLAFKAKSTATLVASAASRSDRADGVFDAHVEVGVTNEVSRVAFKLVVANRSGSSGNWAGGRGNQADTRDA